MRYEENAVSLTAASCIVHYMCGSQFRWQHGAHSRVVRRLLATWNSHNRLHSIGDEENTVSVTAASVIEQVRRVVPILLATWSKTRRVVHVAGSMGIKIGVRTDRQILSCRSQCIKTKVRTHWQIVTCLVERVRSDVWS